MHDIYEPFVFIYRRERESGKLLKKKSHIGNYFFQNQFSTEFWEKVEYSKDIFYNIQSK